MDTAATIVVVDDDPRIRELLRDALEAESYRVLEAPDGETLFALLATHEVDLVTLDLALGSENGLTLMDGLRRAEGVGVIMVTARDELIDTVVGLELGADDYIVKPFDLRELVARVRSVLRRSARRGDADRGNGSTPRSRGPSLVFGQWRLYPKARSLSRLDGTPCELTGTEFGLLVLLAENAHQVLSRDAIMDALKGRDWNPSDRTVDNLVAQLRKKLEEPGEPRLIRTVRGVGYLFAADVERR